MTPRKRRKFSPEFKAEAVALCRVGDRTINKVAKDLDVTPSVMHEWVRQADADAAGSTANGPLTSSEREELQRLRRDNKRLEQEREILKKAAAFFAKESS